MKQLFWSIRGQSTYLARGRRWRSVSRHSVTVIPVAIGTTKQARAPRRPDEHRTSESSSSSSLLSSSSAAGPEEFVKLQGLLVQSSKWFGIRIEYSSVTESLVWEVRSVQFETRGQVPGLRRSVPARGASVQFVKFISQTLPALVWIDLAGLVRLRLGSVHRASKCLGGAEEQF